LEKERLLYEALEKGGRIQEGWRKRETAQETWKQREKKTERESTLFPESSVTIGGDKGEFEGVMRAWSSELDRILYISDTADSARAAGKKNSSDTTCK
jgi:hypothetical protein